MTIVDLDRRQVSVLNVNNKARTQLTFEEILEFVAATSARTSTLPKLLRFASAPIFQQEWDESQNRLYLNHKQMSYSAKLLSPPFDPLESEQLAGQYRTFADWAARLNTMYPGLPPAARLQLNQAIFARQSVPKSVRRITPTTSGSVIDVVSRHSYQWTLSPDDRQEMVEFDDWEKSFTFVSSEQFFAPDRDVPNVEE